MASWIYSKNPACCATDTFAKRPYLAGQIHCSKANKIKFTFCYTAIPEKNTPQSMKHLLGTSYAQGVPATGNYRHCKINLFTLVCVCRACLHPPQLPLDSTTTATPQREGFTEVHRTPYWLPKPSLCRVSVPSLKFSFRFLPSLEEQVSLWNLVTGLQREMSPFEHTWRHICCFLPWSLISLYWGSQLLYSGL